MAKISAGMKARTTRSKHITSLCEQIFDATPHVHGLTTTGRVLLLAAVKMIEIVDFNAPDKDVEIAVEKALSKRAYAKFTPWQKNIISETLKLIHPHFDPGPFVRKLTTNPADGQLQVAARIACILRLCCGIDNSNTQTTTINRIHETGEIIEIFVAGPASSSDSATGRGMGLLWNNLLCREVHVYKVPRVATIKTGPGPGAVAFIESVRVQLAKYVDSLSSREFGLELQQEMRLHHLAAISGLKLNSGSLNSSGFQG